MKGASVTLRKPFKAWCTFTNNQNQLHFTFPLTPLHFANMLIFKTELYSKCLYMRSGEPDVVLQEATTSPHIQDGSAVVLQWKEELAAGRECFTLGTNKYLIFFFKSATIFVRIMEEAGIRSQRQWWSHQGNALTDKCAIICIYDKRLQTTKYFQ